jgi:dihydroorotate dehydrogenase electron transfer subunit
VAAETFRLSLDARAIPDSVQPGQFFMISFPGVFDPLLPRPFAAFDREGERLDLLYRKVGKGTGILAELRTPATLQVFGPLGRGYRTEAAAGTGILIFAGGIGFASVYLLLKDLLSREYPVTLLYGTRFADQLYPLEEELRAHPCLELHLATEDGGEGVQGNVHELYLSLRENEPGFADKHQLAFGCGPLPMLKAFAGTLQALGLPSQVSLEANMACGYGVCQGCAVSAGRSREAAAGGYRKVCADGPVFSTEELDWDALR